MANKFEVYINKNPCVYGCRLNNQEEDNSAFVKQAFDKAVANRVKNAFDVTTLEETPYIVVDNFSNFNILHQADFERQFVKKSEDSASLIAGAIREWGKIHGNKPEVRSANASQRILLLAKYLAERFLIVPK